MNSSVLQHVTFLVVLISVIVAQTEFRRVCRSYQLDVGIRRWPNDVEATHTCVPGPYNGRCFIQGQCCQRSVSQHFFFHDDFISRLKRFATTNVRDQALSRPVLLFQLRTRTGWRREIFCDDGGLANLSKISST